jgi:hypothetical protein
MLDFTGAREMKFSRFLAKGLFSGLAGALALTLYGCVERRGDISGTVRLDGNPVSRGVVTFVSQDNPGLRASSRIGDDGSYHVSDCPVGPVRITCKTAVPHGGKADLAPVGRPEMKSLEVKLPAIPAHYAKPETSGIQCTVISGKQQYDLELVP